MKVRIGVSLGPAGTPAQFADAVDLLEQAGWEFFSVRDATAGPPPASPGPFGPFLDGFVRELLPIQD